MTLRSRLHLYDRNVLRGLVSQHSMADLHDKEGNDNMPKKKSIMNIVSVLMAGRGVINQFEGFTDDC